MARASSNEQKNKSPKNKYDLALLRLIELEPPL
jgi:hypothetical protein